MKCRHWRIYSKKTRNAVSEIYHRRTIALENLHALNNYCGKKKYGIQIIKTDSETGKVISKYPEFDLKEVHHD